MQKITYALVILLTLSSCIEKKTSETIIERETKVELSTAQKIANAHGFENWQLVDEVSFNFNGKRSWNWNPKTGDVIYSQDSIKVSYNRSKIDSSLTKIDRAFINDKFWLLIPFQLVWDKDASISEPIKESSPINKKELNKIIITYSSQGGYTPGDAYDIFYNDNFIIEEWIFRKGNQNEPSLITTFESYNDFKGIKIALEHKNKNGNWNLKFTDVEIN